MKIILQIAATKRTGAPLILGLLLVLFFSQLSFGQDVLWFSNTPPPSEKGIRPVGMHRFSGKKGKRGSSNIIQWLRRGSSPTESQYIHLTDSNSFEFQFYTPQEVEGKGKFINRKNAYLTYPSNDEGYFNAYLIHRKLSSDTLYLSIAKADMLNHSCRNGHKNVHKYIGPHTYPTKVQAELVRLRGAREDFHYFAKSSDKIKFLLLVNGKPQPNAEVTFVTQKGWQKTLFTNKEGIVEFQLIQDYFSNWQELNTRKIFYYLVFAELTIKDTGTYKEQAFNYVHYTTSLTDGYRPATIMYKSMFWAFIIFIVSLILSVAAIFIYRIRRNKIYKEVDFDE